MTNSDMFDIDLSNYKDRVGARVDPGVYRVQVEDVEADKSAAGNPMINVWYRITGGAFDGSTIVDRLTMTEKSMFRVVNFMQAIGLPTPKRKLQINIRRFVGQVLDIEVHDGEPFNGRIKSEVLTYMRAVKGREQARDLDDDEGEQSYEGLDEFAPGSTSNPSDDPADADGDDVPADADDGVVDLDDIKL